MACRSGCKTKLYAFSDARKQGIMPAGTTMGKIEQAHRISDRTGVAFDASDPTKGLL